MFPLRSGSHPLQWLAGLAFLAFLVKSPEKAAAFVTAVFDAVVRFGAALG